MHAKGIIFLFNIYKYSKATVDLINQVHFEKAIKAIFPDVGIFI